MCGIAGFINDAGRRSETIEKMMDRLYHRGPDAGDAWLDEQSGVTFGFRRLAIRDVSMSGMQPMHSRDGRFVIVFNGEIYNADELRSSMEAAGCKDLYRSGSDTEVLLNAFAHYGVHGTLERIRGMFAIALYDRSEKRLYLMRDRIGEKPLFYGMVDGHFVFASELGALREYPHATEHIRRDVLPAYMQYGYIPAPDTIYEGIYKVLPGQCLSLRAPFQKIEKELYYDIRAVARQGEAQPFRGSFSEAVEELDRLLTASVRGQMIADVPLGAYLSGGIDSAAVVALMTKLSGEKVRTFSIGFDEKKYDEAPAARAIAQHLGTQHFEQYVSEKELQEVIPKIPFIYGEPFADSSQIPTCLVSKLAKSQVTVSLSGDAGDELFCGYVTYPKIHGLWQKLQKGPYGLRRMAGAVGRKAHFGSNTVYRSGVCMQAGNILELKEAVDHMDPMMEKLAFRGQPLAGERILSDEVHEMQLADMRQYLPDDILVKVDRAGMAVSLENRIPMLDKDVVAFAFSLPAAFAYDGTVTKKVLKEVLYRYVPKELMDRPKKGFSVPLKRWLSEGHTAEWTAELLGNSLAAEDGLLEKKAVQKLWHHFVKNGTSPHLVWNVLMLEQWYRKDRGKKA
ncbi:MAG: asparagine synthase (glutamine-hydrolyzing) [Lachnospiraceae bacterium]|nr:asparagine synthase (glutamine-hydrolyzing) [Lachnospiraceae bacterium]